MLSNSFSVTGPTRLVDVKPWLGVAQTSPKRNPPATQATRIPANSSFNGILCLAPLATVSSVLNVNMASLPRSALELRDIASGAQTERRGGAGPAGACLAVRTPPADFSSRDPSLLRGARD